MQSDKIWISSDWHLGHKNIVKGVSTWTDKEGSCRDFKELETHDAWIIDEINRNVKQDDTLYFLGDFSFGGIENIRPYRERIICKNIHLIYGNHDDHIRKTVELQYLFSSTQYYLELKISKKEQLIMMHYPIRSWRSMAKGYLHIYGHQHSGKIGPGRSMDVGIEANGEMKGIYSLEEVLDTLRKIPIYNNHHNKEEK